MTAFWKEAHDEGGLAWDDTNNNRAFLSQTICSTLNGASIYIESLRNPDKYITEKGAQLKTDIQHSPLPRGPAGQFAMHTFFSHVIPNYSKNQAGAKEFLKWIHTPANYDPWFVSQKGFSTPPTHAWEKHKLWDEDPVMLPFRSAARSGRLMGYAGPPSRKAAEVLSKYIAARTPSPDKLESLGMGQLSPIAGQGQRLALVLFRRCRNQLRQADRSKQASGNTAGETIAGAGQNR